jgi:peptidyl-prolyl cis-trans isomerase D
MLVLIRDKATGWVAGVIVGLLVISFAFWGVSFYSGQAGKLNVAKVNDVDISFQSFQRSFVQLRKKMQSVLGDSLSLEEDTLIKNQTIEKLIESELINQLVIDSGLNITNERLVESIKNIEFFRNEEGFDRIKYERSINSIGMAPSIFEAQLRMDLLSNQLQAGFFETTFILESELENILRLESQSRDVTYTILSLPSFIEDGEISDSDVDVFYQANPNLFTQSEQVKVAYLELNIKELAKDIETNEEVLRNFYNDNKGDYDVVGQRSIRKLFVKTGEKATNENKNKAEAVITSALELANEGKDFVEIVEQSTGETLEFSEHTFMSKGIMGKEIDEFLFNSEEGMVSKVIETKEGFNIVKVVEIRGGSENKYENSTQKVKEDYKNKQAELQFFELSDQLITLSYENSDNLEIAADAIDKEIINTDYFARDNDLEGLLSDPLIISKSFDPELIRSRNNSDAIELSDNHIVVLRVIEHKEVVTKPLEDVRDEVIASIRLKLAREKTNETGDRIVAELKSGVNPESIISHSGIEWTTTEKVKRDDMFINRAILRSIFEAGKPNSNEPIITSQRLGSGDYAIIVVLNAYNETLEVDEELKKRTDLKLRRTLSTNEWQDLLRDVRNNTNIRIFNENI